MPRQLGPKKWGIPEWLRKKEQEEGAPATNRGGGIPDWLHKKEQEDRAHVGSMKVAYVSHCPGHTNSKGEAAPWCIRQHNTNKILESFKSESAAKEGLKNMESHKGSVKEAFRSESDYPDDRPRCSMCDKPYMPTNNGDDRSPCCTAERKAEVKAGATVET